MPNRRSARLWCADYAAAGIYFVTICAFERKPILGEIHDARAFPSRLGSLARECWLTIPDHFGRTKLDEFVVMPNHLHGILVFYPRVGAQHGCARSGDDEGQMKPGSLGAVIRSFKAIVTRRAHEENGWIGPVWQRNYYERIVRDAEELSDTRRYIVENPGRWEFDEENPGRG